MATPLDIGLLQDVSVIFPFLLILTLVYGVLSMTKIFGENKGLYAVIAFVLAIMTLFSNIALKTINLMAPWFVLLFVFVIFLLIGYQAFGIEKGTIVDIVKGEKYGGTFFYWMLALVLIIALGSLSFVISEEKGFQALSEGPDDITVSDGEEDVGFFQTIFHPKLLGAVLLLMVAMFTVRALAGPEV